MTHEEIAAKVAEITAFFKASGRCPEDGFDGLEGDDIVSVWVALTQGRPTDLKLAVAAHYVYVDRVLEVYGVQRNK